jgi:molecular chaperone DnaK (HSP70)
MEPSGPRIIENAEGLRSSPSVISFDQEGKEHVATAAKRQVLYIIK